jgi:hypothetical protein
MSSLLFRRLNIATGTVLAYLSCSADHSAIAIEDSTFPQFFTSLGGRATFSSVSVINVTSNRLVSGSASVTMFGATIDRSNISVGFQLTAGLALNQFEATRSHFNSIVNLNTVSSGQLSGVTVTDCVTSGTAFFFDSPNIYLMDAVISNSTFFALIDAHYHSLFSTGLTANLTRVQVQNNQFNSDPISLEEYLLATIKSVTLKNNTGRGSLVAINGSYIQLVDFLIAGSRLTTPGHLLALSPSLGFLALRIQISDNTVQSGDAVLLRSVPPVAFVMLADIVGNSIAQGATLSCFGNGIASLALILGQIVNNSIQEGAVVSLDGRPGSLKVRTSRVSFYRNQVNQTFHCQAATLSENGSDLCAQSCPADQCNTCPNPTSNTSNQCVLCSVAWGSTGMCDCPYWSKLACPLGCQVNTSWCPDVLDCTGTTVVCNATVPLPPDVTITNTSVYFLGNQTLAATVVVGSGSYLYFTDCGNLASQFFVDATSITDGGQLVLATSDLSCLSYDQSTTVEVQGTESRPCETFTAQQQQTTSSFSVLFSVEQVPNCVTGADSSSVTTALARSLTTTTIVLVGVFLGLILVLGIALFVFLLCRSQWCQNRRTGARKHQMAKEGDFVDDSDEAELDRLARRRSTQNYSSLEPSATLSTNL